MHWQREVLRSSIGMTFNQTYELDLPKTGILGSLVLYIRSNGVAAGLVTARRWRLIDWISKIEVIGDGSVIIKSFDGPQALASAFHDDLQEPPSMWRTYSTTAHRQWIPLHFGRKLMDELYALDLARFNQVTLKVTNTATSTQFTTDIDIDVIAYWMREGAPALLGYFREEEWREWDPVAATWEYNDLPTALPIRRILLRGRPAVDTADSKANSSMVNLMADIEFTFKTGQTRVYRGSLFNLGFLSILELGRFAETRGAIDRTAGYGFESGVGYGMQNLGYGTSDADGITTALSNMRKDIQDPTQEVGYRSGDGPMAWVVRGFGYMENVPLWYARKPDLADLLDPLAQNVVKVDIQPASGTTVTGTDVNAKNAIILSRLVR